MAVTILLEAYAKDGSVDELIDILNNKIFPDTRTYDGFIDIYIIQDQDNPNTIFLVEEWESKSNYDSYLQWRTERGDIDTLVSFLTGPPTIRYFKKR